MTTTKDRVRALLEEHVGPASAQSFSDTDKIWVIGERLGVGDLDSLDRTEFLMACEEEFGVKIPDPVAQDLFTIEQIANFVDLHAGAAHGGH